MGDDKVASLGERVEGGGRAAGLFLDQQRQRFLAGLGGEGPALLAQAEDRDDEGGRGLEGEGGGAHEERERITQEQQPPRGRG